MTTPWDTQPPQPRPPRSSLGVQILKGVAVAVLIGVVALVGFQLAPRLAESVAGDVTISTLPPGENVEFAVQVGDTAGSIGRELEDAGLIIDGATFETTVRIQGVGSQLQAGDYVLVSGTSLDDLIDQLIAGPPAPNVFRVTVVEGLRIDEMLASLAKQTEYTKKQLAAPLLDGSVTSFYLPDEIPEDAPELTRWEGLLFPSTYEFLEGASPAQIVGKLAAELEFRMAEIDWSEVEDLGLTDYDGLVVASLIEKEAKLAEDRPVIASVVYNRLAESIELQIDATVIYALGENPGRVLERHLAIDSPWNTYLYGGLPPTPIGGVGVASLEAASMPDETNYFYYVLVDEDGSHGFSETLEEHEEKVAKAREDGVLP